MSIPASSDHLEKLCLNKCGVPLTLSHFAWPDLLESRPLCNRVQKPLNPSRRYMPTISHQEDITILQAI